MDFVTMVSGSLRKQGKWVPCEHMYYVLQHVMFCGQFDIFIHLSLAMKFVACWFFFCFYVSRNNNQAHLLPTLSLIMVDP